MASLPTDYLYSAEHEWVNSTDVKPGDVVRVGITQYAADQLGEIVYVELPEVGTEAEAGERAGEQDDGRDESTESVSDIYAPVSGEVVAVNEDLEDSAAVINDDPYGEGWIYEVRVTEAGPLMDAEAYAAENDD